MPLDRLPLGRWVCGAAALGAAALALAIGDARAQSAPRNAPRATADAINQASAATWNRTLHHALQLPEWIDLAVEHRSRFEYLAHPFRRGEPERQSQYPHRSRLRLGLDPWGSFRVLGELQAANARSVADGDFTSGQIDRLDVLQLFAAATQLDLLGSGLRGDVQAGRLSLDFGGRRVVSRNGTRNTVNAFDGVHLQLGAADLGWRARAFYVLPVAIEEGSFDNRSSSHQQFWGLAFEDTRREALQFDASYFRLRDRAGDRRFHTGGFRVRRPARTAQTDYELDLVGQLGDRAGRDHRAYAAHAEVGYTFEAPGSPRLALQVEYASGSDDPNGDRSETFDPLFGSRRADMMPTALFGPFRRANVFSPGLRLTVTPTPALRAQLKWRYWQLAQGKDAFVGTRLQDPSGRAGRNLGSEVELSVQWNFRPWLSFDVGADYWFKGSYYDRVPNSPSRDNTYYFYAASQLRF